MPRRYVIDETVFRDLLGGQTVTGENRIGNRAEMMLDERLDLERLVRAITDIHGTPVINPYYDLPHSDPEDDELP